MESPLNEIIRIPKGFIEHPPAISSPEKAVFAQYSSGDGKKQISLQIGLVDRWQRTPSQPGPGFLLEDISILFALISFYQSHHSFSPEAKLPPLSYNQIFKIITPNSKSCSSHHREKLKTTLARLSNIDIKLEDPTHPEFAPLLQIKPAHSAPVFGRITPHFAIELNPHFRELLCDTQSCTPFNIGSFFSLRSRYARALALFLPTWAAYHKSLSPKFPFKITLAKLIEHLGLPVPKYKAQRRAIFGGHRQNDIFKAINNLNTPFGSLQTDIQPATSVEDDCLCIWLKDSPLKNRSLNPRSPDFRSLKIFEAWENSGRTPDEFTQRVQAASRLSPYDQDCLRSAKVSLQKSERFLTMAKKLVTQRTWEDLLGEVKYASNSTTPPKNPTARIIGEMLNAIRAGL